MGTRLAQFNPPESNQAYIMQQARIITRSLNISASEDEFAGDGEPGEHEG